MCLHWGFPISAARRSSQSSPKTELLPRSWPAALRHSWDTDNFWLWVCGAQSQLNHIGNCGWEWKTRLTKWLFILVFLRICILQSPNILKVCHIYSSSCHSKPVWLSLFCETQKKILWKVSQGHKSSEDKRGIFWFWNLAEKLEWWTD